MTDRPDIEALLTSLLGNYLAERTALEKRCKIFTRMSFSLDLIGLISSMLGILLNFLGFWVESSALKVIDFSNDLIILGFVTLSLLGNLDTKVQVYRGHIRDLTSAADSITRKKIALGNSTLTTEQIDRFMLYLERMQEKLTAIQHNNAVV